MIFWAFIKDYTDKPQKLCGTIPTDTIEEWIVQIDDNSAGEIFDDDTVNVYVIGDEDLQEIDKPDWKKPETFCQRCIVTREFNPDYFCVLDD